MKICGCKGQYQICKDCRPSQQLEFWTRDTSYRHIMGDDEGWDPDQAMLTWTQNMERAEVRKYLIKCECLQCQALGRKYRWGWVEIDALWCIELRHKYGVLCPYCYHRFSDYAHMVITIEDAGDASEEEAERLGLKPEQFIGLESNPLIS